MSTARALLVLALTFATAPGLDAQAPAAEKPLRLRDAFAAASQGLRTNDHEAVRRALRAALTWAPDDSHVLFHLARAEAMTGNAEASLATLERLAVQGVARDITADTTFANLQKGVHADRFRAVAARLKEAATPIVRGDTAWTVPDPDFIPEGIAHDAKTDAFYVGSLHHGGVDRVTRAGVATAFIPSTPDRLDEIVGLRVDAPRNRLWLAAFTHDSTAPRLRNGTGGRTALYAYDLRTGARVARHAPLDSTSRPHFFNDVAIAANGDVWVTDSEGEGVYRLRNGAKTLVRVYGDRPDFTYPNGIAIAPVVA